MLSRDFRLEFIRNSRSFPVFPRSEGDDRSYSATAISFQMLPCAFFCLAWLALFAVAQGTAAPERSSVPASSQSSGPTMKDASGVSTQAVPGIHLDVDLALV